jgi:hypothetical protein
VAEHHLPAVARYDATAADLDYLHRLYHAGPDRRDEAVRRSREILRMPGDDG